MLKQLSALCFSILFLIMAPNVSSEPVYMTFMGTVISVETDDNAEPVESVQTGDTVRYVFLVDFHKQGNTKSVDGNTTVFSDIKTRLFEVRYFFTDLIAGNIIHEPLGYYKRPGIVYDTSINLGFQYDFVNDFSHKDDFVRFVAGNSNDELTIEIKGLVEDIGLNARATASYSSYDSNGNLRMVNADLTLESVVSSSPHDATPYPGSSEPSIHYNFSLP